MPTARQAVAKGWRVALGARSEDKLEALAGELGEENAFAKRCDVTEWDDQVDFVSAPEQWRSMVLTNVLGVAYSIRAALPQFKEPTPAIVTLIEPGMVDTPFFDEQPSGALQAADIARAIIYALEEPARVDVNEILIRPINQPL